MQNQRRQLYDLMTQSGNDPVEYARMQRYLQQK